VREGEGGRGGWSIVLCGKRRASPGESLKATREKKKHAWRGGPSPPNTIIELWGNPLCGGEKGKEEFFPILPRRTATYVKMPKVLWRKKEEKDHLPNDQTYSREKLV